MIKRIISGGQTGADQGGLLAARDCGIETGGTAPKGYRTEVGPDIRLRDWGLTESFNSSYQHRTLRNVLDADLTLLFFRDMNSPSTRLTLQYAAREQRPLYAIEVSETCMHNFHNLARTLSTVTHNTVNVAGHRESTYPGICAFTQQFMTKLIEALP